MFNPETSEIFFAEDAEEEAVRPEGRERNDG